MAARNTFHYPVRVVFGTGDDRLVFASSSPEYGGIGNSVFSGFQASGGSGTDSLSGLDGETSTTFLKAPRLTSFESRA